MLHNKTTSADSGTVEWDRLSQPVRAISRAARLLTRVGDNRLRVLGFSVGQLPVLMMLKNGAALSQTQMAQQAQIEQPSMAQILARMERDGLIQSVPDPDDGRRRLITLTGEALARFPEARLALFQGHREALQGFSENEIETLTTLLVRVIENLDNALKSSSTEPKE